MARLSLSLLLLTLLAGHGAEASEVAPPVAEPLPLDYWQAGDWKGLPDATRIDKQTVLFAKHDSENYLGLAILLPDWQRSGQLWQLTRALGQLGFDTLLLLPSPSRLNSILPPRKKRKTAMNFASSLPNGSASWPMPSCRKAASS